jgi:phosphoribosylformimino-5-aminoimidazole carboxamide ribotide isomerase
MLIYPAIDLLHGRCVRLKQGDYSRETVFSDDPVDMARRWVKQGADRLHVVDLDGAKSGQPANGAIVRKIVEAVDIPVQLGGGLRTDDHVAAAFDWGVRWAVVGTQALQNQSWLRTAAKQYPHRIVLGIDAKDGRVATEGWLNVSSMKAIELAKVTSDLPLASLVYTDIARDGMLSGPNFEALSEMQQAVSLPIIASGGISTLDHVRKLIDFKAAGCIIGRALYEGSLDLSTVLNLTRFASGPVT